MPTPMTSSASRTLTAAMMPSRRLVVPRSPVIGYASKRRGLMRRRIAAWLFLANRTAHVIQQLPAFVRHAGRFVNGRSEALELAGEVFDRRLDLPSERSSAGGEEEVADGCANHRTRTRRRHRSRVIVHTASVQREMLQVMCRAEASAYGG